MEYGLVCKDKVKWYFKDEPSIISAEDVDYEVRTSDEFIEKSFSGQKIKNTPKVNTLINRIYTSFERPSKKRSNL